MPTKLGRGIWIFTLLAIAVLSWQWSDDRNVETLIEADTIEMAENQSDYYLEDFEIINITNPERNNDSKNGRYMRMVGKSLSHHYLEGYSSIEQPGVQLRTDNNEEWQANALNGQVSANFDVLNLQGEVELTHNRSLGKPPISVDTNSITIDSTARVISTDDTVEVNGSGWNYKANSMRAEIDNGVLSFTSGVEARFANPKNQ